MAIPELALSTHIADQLNLLAHIVKTRSRAGYVDVNVTLESIVARVLNALKGWELKNLNRKEHNFPAVDLGDRHRKLAIQVTNVYSSTKIKETWNKAIKHELSKTFNTLVVFFLLSQKPPEPKGLRKQKGLDLEAWDIADLLREMKECSPKRLALAASVLDEVLPSVGKANPQMIVDPQLIARFQEDGGELVMLGKKSDPSYCMDLWVQNAPRETSKVTFEILDDSVVKDNPWSVRRSREHVREFLTNEGFDSWGNYMICAKGIGKQPGGNWFVQSTLYNALVRYHGPPMDKTDKEIRKALIRIRDN